MIGGGVHTFIYSPIGRGRKMDHFFLRDGKILHGWHGRRHLGAHLLYPNTTGSFLSHGCVLAFFDTPIHNEDVRWSVCVTVCLLLVASTTRCHLNLTFEYLEIYTRQARMCFPPMRSLCLRRDNICDRPHS